MELVDGLEFDNIETVRKNTIRFSLQQVLALVCSDMRHGRENIGAVCGRSFYAVSVVDTSFPSFMIDVEILEVVVKVYRTGT